MVLDAAFEDSRGRRRAHHRGGLGRRSRQERGQKAPKEHLAPENRTCAQTRRRSEPAGLRNNSTRTPPSPGSNGSNGRRSPRPRCGYSREMGRGRGGGGRACEGGLERRDGGEHGGDRRREPRARRMRLRTRPGARVRGGGLSETRGEKRCAGLGGGELDPAAVEAWAGRGGERRGGARGGAQGGARGGGGWMRRACSRAMAAASTDTAVPVARRAGAHCTARSRPTLGAAQHSLAADKVSLRTKRGPAGSGVPACPPDPFVARSNEA